jgi:hypothetical protein
MLMEELKYGAVLFIEGKLKGKLGYYDDNEGEQAIVYLGKPFQSEQVIVSFNEIRNITSLEHEKFKKENSDFCDILDII